MDEREFKRRTKGLGLAVIRVVESLPKGRTADVVARQLVRSATSVGANYRAACRGRSVADGIVPQDRVAHLVTEADELVAMTVASIKTLKSRARPI
jgi:hypothetical protein